MTLTNVIYSEGTPITSANLNDIQYNIINYCVPTYTNDNDGQILMVVGDHMEWVCLVSAEEIPF